MKKAKFKSIEYAPKSWDGGAKPMWFHKVVMDNGDEGQITTMSDKPDWLVVGGEIEYSLLTDKKGNPKIKKEYTQNGGGGKSGGYKKPRLELVDIKRMCKSNAVHAVVSVNSTKGSEVLSGKDLATILEFTIGGLTDGIEKFGEDDSLLTSRLSAVNNAAIMAAYKEFKDGKDLVTEATKLFNYITAK
jgi:hypothetical protein